MCTSDQGDTGLQELTLRLGSQGQPPSAVTQSQNRDLGARAPRGQGDGDAGSPGPVSRALVVWFEGCALSETVWVAGPGWLADLVRTVGPPAPRRAL